MFIPNLDPTDTLNPNNHTPPTTTSASLTSLVHEDHYYHYFSPNPFLYYAPNHDFLDDPSPIILDHDQDHRLPPPPPIPEEEEDKMMMMMMKKKRSEVKVIRKRSTSRGGKKDRHSKIYTAKGARDRRMRLSLPIARRFFDLQDMLGFDKASKTIEWLFTMSKSAIQDLQIDVCTTCSTSTCSEISTEVVVMASAKSTRNKKVKMESCIASTKHRSISKEARDKARARARERTLEKKNKKKKMLEESSYYYSGVPCSSIVDEQCPPCSNSLKNPISSALPSSSSSLLGLDSGGSELFMIMGSQYWQQVFK